MPASLPQAPIASDAPVPAFREPVDQRLRGRLPKPSRVHRRDPQTGSWVEVDEPEQGADVDDLGSPDEVSAVRRDARGQIVKDEAALRRLAPAAMTDPKVAAECADIQSRLRAARDVLELDDLAREEDARERREAAEEEERQRREGHLAVAAKLEKKRAEAAARIDAGARSFADAIAEYNSLVGPLEQELRAGGDRDPMRVRPASWSFMSALRAAAGAAGIERALDFPPRCPAVPFGPTEPSEAQAAKD